jgi:uncharacterized protein YndB with AHSA1/START domain
MTQLSIQKSMFLAASRERVWEYLTDPDALSSWFHRPDQSLQSGAPFEMNNAEGNKICWGEVQTAEPPSHLTYTFTAGPMNGLMTTVTWTLTAVEGGTRLELIHDGFPSGAEAFGLLAAFDAGWDDHLKRMRSVDD